MGVALEGLVVPVGLCDVIVTNTVAFAVFVVADCGCVAGHVVERVIDRADICLVVDDVTVEKFGDKLGVFVFELGVDGDFFNSGNEIL